MTRLARDRYGTTAIEYALIASLISIVIVEAADMLGGDVLDLFSRVSAGFPK